MPSTVQFVASLPPNATHEVDGGGAVTEAWAQTPGGFLRVFELSSAGATIHGTYDNSPTGVLVDHGWRPADVPAQDPDGNVTPWPDEWQKRWGRVFRYFFRYPEDQQALVRDFCAAVNAEWSSTVKAGSLPSAFDEQQADSGLYLLEYDTLVAEAVQYGREEPIAQRVDGFDNVDFAKTMTPDIDWAGMYLTDPRDGNRKFFEPGDLHLTDDPNLTDQIGTTVRRSDLESAWSLTFS